MSDSRNKYIRDHYRSFSVRYNKENEADVIAWLESRENLKDYLTALIRADQGRRRRRKRE